MNGLFKVRRKTFKWEQEKIYTVYHIKLYSNKAYNLRFLIYKDGKWTYVIADDYEPVAS